MIYNISGVSNMYNLRLGTLWTPLGFKEKQEFTTPDYTVLVQNVDVVMG